MSLKKLDHEMCKLSIIPLVELNIYLNVLEYVNDHIVEGFIILGL